jgi:hypothetical protein
LGGSCLDGFKHSVSRYNEFYDETLMSINPDALNIDRIRLVCESGREDMDLLCDIVNDMDGDDYQRFEIEPREDGGYSIVCICYGVRNEDFITISSEGLIGNTGIYTYLKLLKDRGVRVFRKEAQTVDTETAAVRM